MSPATVKGLLAELLPHASTNYTCVTLLPSRFPACGLLAGVMQESLVRCAAPSWEKKFSPAPDPVTPMEPATPDAAPLLSATSVQGG